MVSCTVADMFTIIFLVSLLCKSYSLLLPTRAVPSFSRSLGIANKVRMSSSQSETLEVSRFLTPTLAENIRQQYGTPVYVYDEKTLTNQALTALQFPNLYGLKVRYAMKASPNAAILQLFHRLGLNFDASSGFEVRRAILAGVSPQDISLSSQELPQDFKELIELGIEFNACSLKQLDTFGRLFPGGSCGVRFNPGKGSGGTGKTVKIGFD